MVKIKVDYVRPRRDTGWDWIYKAYIEGQPLSQETGKTSAEAVGKVVINMAEALNLEIDESAVLSNE